MNFMTKQKKNKKEHRDKLLKIKGEWLSISEINKNRNQVEKQIANRWNSYSFRQNKSFPSKS